MRVAVVDYGAGNLHTLVRALEAGGAIVQVDQTLAPAGRAQALVLPGCGAFAPAAARLASSVARLHQLLRAGMPCLGIGVGMQLLFEGSDLADGPGLAVFGGRVHRLDARRVPHIGWNDVTPARADPLLPRRGLVAWFANSCFVQPTEPASVTAWTEFEGVVFPAVIRHERIWGVQFQPEKSGPRGLAVLHRFLDAARSR
jgi:glutamine amidotransferase